MMQTFLTLQEQGRQRTPFVHFSQVIGRIGETLAKSISCANHTLPPSDAFAISYLGRNLSRKAANLSGLTTDPELIKKATLDGFLARERVNREINQNVTWGYDGCTGEFSSDVLGDQLLYKARDIIYDIVGESPDLDRIVRGSSFGNGASCTMKRVESDATNKWIHGLSVTTGLSNFMARVIESSPAWAELTNSDPVWTVDHNGSFRFSESNFTKVAGAVLDFVPKTNEIMRIILKEAELNGFIQKGIGKEFRRLLRKPTVCTDGIDLNQSGSVNSRLACEGSVNGLTATVDGERASDSLTLALYELLFPPKWYELLIAARSPYAVIDGLGMLRLEMMSGMGNGFTFEAESIIFYAIGLACAERSNVPFAERLVSIHGDDLIIPADVFDLCRAAYTSAGVVINSDKSFSDGPFRESCGGHFYEGKDVKPFYVKAQNGKSRGDWFWLANSLLLWLNSRSEEFLASTLGVELTEILRYLNWYASSGQPQHWKVPVDYSRRAGLYSDAPKLFGSSWKTRTVGVIPVKININREGKYLQWLNKPNVVTAFDLIFGHKPTDDDQYTTAVETMEVDRYKRLTAWNGFAECGIRTPLWFWSHLRSLATS